MNTLVIISGLAIIALGVIYFLYSLSLIFRRSKGLKHYERMRDTLVLADVKADTDEDSDVDVHVSSSDDYSGGGLGIGSIIPRIIGGAIIVMIGVTLLPEISKVIQNATIQGDAVGTSLAFLQAAPLIFTAVIILMIFIFTWHIIRNAGFGGI